MKKKVFIFLFNGFSDWEISYLTPEVNKSNEYDLIYFSIESSPITSMGGLKVLPDISIKGLDINEVEMLILPGGEAWEGDGNDHIDTIVQSLFAKGKTIAAICAATTYLGKKGILDEVKHTSNDPDYLKSIASAYKGGNNYINTSAIADQNIITANGTAPIEFTREVFRKLNLYNESDIETWYQLFKNGAWDKS
ncbi:MAG: type 1 glutamine amidotransferase family protein [Bacteroidota bacterium]